MTTRTPPPETPPGAALSFGGKTCDERGHQWMVLGNVTNHRTVVFNYICKQCSIVGIETVIASGKPTVMESKDE